MVWLYSGVTSEYASETVPLRVMRVSEFPIIAIVDDDDAVREALSDLLHVEGFGVRGFEDGAAFLADEAADEYDCVITDVRMPNIDGIELQQRLHARGSRSPMIFITSSDDKAMRASALERGAIAWFSKPFTDEALLGALRRALEPPGR